MLETPHFCAIDRETQSVEKEGVVLLVINPLNGTIAYGYHNLDNGRGRRGQTDIPCESREPGDASFLETLSRLGVEELGEVNWPQVWVGDDLADHYLGTAWFGEGIVAQVFWAIGLPQRFTNNGVLAASRRPEDDFIFEGFIQVEALMKNDSLRPRVRYVLEEIEVEELVVGLGVLGGHLLASGNIQPIEMAIKSDRKLSFG